MIIMDRHVTAIVMNVIMIGGFSSVSMSVGLITVVRLCLVLSVKPLGSGDGASVTYPVVDVSVVMDDTTGILILAVPCVLQDDMIQLYIATEAFTFIHVSGPVIPNSWEGRLLLYICIVPSLVA